MSSKPRKIVRKHAVYPLPPEKVWVALTDPRAIAEWLMPNDFKAEVGHRFRLQVDRMPGTTGIVLGEVIEVDHPRRLSYSWVEGEADGTRRLKRDGRTFRDHTIVTWTLDRTAQGGTKLTLEHIGVEVIPWLYRLMMAFGWGTMVKRWIPKVASRVDDDGSFAPGAIPLHKRCYKIKTIPDHLVR
jgi:uncharacterized protein YndB with AHSA1/START domain